MTDPTNWLTVTELGLYVIPGDFYVDAQRGVCPRGDHPWPLISTSIMPGPELTH